MNSPEEIVRVQRERLFAPHHLLLGAAEMTLELAEKREPGWLYYELITTTFAGMAVEALTNSFGARLITDWQMTHERKPIRQKIRLLQKKLNIPDADLRYSDLEWLIELRNSVAHAKPESVKFDSRMPREQFEKMKLEYPKSALELQISLKNAQRALSIADRTFRLFCDNMPKDELRGLLSDSFSGSVSRVQA